MKIISRYMMTSVLLAMAAVYLVILVLNLLSVIIEGIGDIQGEFTFVRVLIYACWRIPGVIADNVAFVSLIGSLVGLGLLASHNELTVLRASGVSLLQIFWLTMRPVLVVMVIGIGIGEVAPHAERVAEAYRIVHRATLPGQTHTYKNLNEHSVWDREANEFIRFAEALPDGRIYGLTRFAFNEDRSLAWIQHARLAIHNENHWQLEDVSTTVITPSMSRRIEKTAVWQTEFVPEMASFMATDPENLNFIELSRYKAYLDAQHRDSKPYELAWWKKLLRPFAIMSLVLVAVSFVFGPLRQVTVGQRVLAGALTGIVFQILINMLGTSSLVFGFSSFVALSLPIIACAMIGVVLLWRVR